MFRDVDSGYSFLRSHPQGPLEDGPPEVSPTVYEGISFFLGVWGSLGYLPRVCGQNHGSFFEDHFAQLFWTVWTRLVSDLYNTMVGTVNLECPVDLIFGSQNHLPFGKTNMAIEYPHVQWYILWYCTSSNGPSSIPMLALLEDYSKKNIITVDSFMLFVWETGPESLPCPTSIYTSLLFVSIVLPEGGYN